MFQNHRTGISERLRHVLPLRNRGVRIRPVAIRSSQLLKRIRPTQIRRSMSRIRVPVRDDVNARATHVQSPRTKTSRVISAPSRRNINMRRLRSNVVNNQKFSRQNVIIADTANINSRVGFQSTGGSTNRQGTFDRFIDRLTGSINPIRSDNSRGGPVSNQQTVIKNGGQRPSIDINREFKNEVHRSGMPGIEINKPFPDHGLIAPLLPASNMNQAHPPPNVNPVQSSGIINSVEPSAMINPLDTPAFMNHVDPSAMMNPGHSPSMPSMNPLHPSASTNPAHQSAAMNPAHPSSAMNPGHPLAMPNMDMGMPIPINEANTELGDPHGLLDHFGMAFKNNPQTVNAKRKSSHSSLKNQKPSQSSKTPKNSRSMHSVHHDAPPDPLAHLLKPEVATHPRPADIFRSMLNGHLNNPGSFQADAAKNSSSDVLNVMGALSLPKSVSNDLIHSLLFDIGQSSPGNQLPSDSNPNSKLMGKHNDIYQHLQSNNNPFQEFRL